MLIDRNGKKIADFKEHECSKEITERLERQ